MIVITHKNENSKYVCEGDTFRLTIDDKTVSAQTSRPSLRVLTGNMHKGFNVSIDWRTRTSAHLARGAGLQEVFQMVHGQEARTSQVNRQKWARG